MNSVRFKSTFHLTTLGIGALLLFFSPTLQEIQAAFSLNFKADETGYTSTGDNSNFSCGYSSAGQTYIGRTNFNCGNDFNGIGSHDVGAMFQRTFVTGGKLYYNVIIGDARIDDFYMEYIIEAGTGSSSSNYSGFGNYDGRSDAPASASAYTAGSISNCSSTANCLFNMTNPYSPDSSRNGNGTGNPNRVIMRMILDDGITYNEFLKDQFDRKPLIKQTMNDPSPSEGISMEYTLDMRDKTYSDSSAIDHSKRINRTFLIGDIAANQGDYDSTGAVATPISFRQGNDDITAGAFTYTTGSSYGGSNGTYTYYLADGVTVDFSGFQPVNKDYSAFCIPDQNTNWSGNGACVNGNGTSTRRTRGWGGW